MTNKIRPKRLYKIGEFSRICKISIKALRHYHELGLLEPNHIDEESAYRYYTEKQLERAVEIQSLRQLEFSLKEIADIFNGMSDDDDLQTVVKQKSELLVGKINRLQSVHDQLQLIIAANERPIMVNTTQVCAVDVPDQLVACIRFKGRYAEVGTCFKKIFKAAGFKTHGKPATLYYDDSYKEQGAEMECYVPIKKTLSGSEESNGGVSSRLLKGGRAYSLHHIGPYEKISVSYKKIIDYLHENDVSLSTPSREIYHKGPGMIFKGNPDKYVTEILFFEE